VLSDLREPAGAKLAVTLAPLAPLGSGDDIKAALDRIAAEGLRFVQMAGTMPGLRPRELDRAARRDLLANLRRRELALAGLDAWLPPAHFGDPAHSDRAIAAACEIIDLAHDLGRVPVSLMLPSEAAAALAIVERADRMGVALADHSIPQAPRENVGAGIDPAAWLSHGKDPVAGVHELGRRLTCARLVDLLRSGMRGPVGTAHEGRLEILPYKIALSVNEYRRPVVIDARQWSEPWRGVAQSIRAWADA